MSQQDPQQPPSEAPPAPAPPPAAMATIPAPPLPTADRRSITVDQLALLPDSERRTNWINSLVEADIERQHYMLDRAMARDFAMAGLFDDIKGSTAEQAIAAALVKILLGRSWGFGPADSMKYIYFTNGRPAIENDIVASKLQQAGYDWTIEWLEETVDYEGRPWQKCIGCRLWLKKWNAVEQQWIPIVDRNGKDVSVAFTKADADHALIWEKGKQIPLSSKWNFQSWGRDMYYWRTVSRVKKFHAPHVLRGLLSRDEAAEAPPAVLPPEQMPRELQPPADDPPPKTRLRDVVMKAESFIGAEGEQPGLYAEDVTPPPTPKPGGKK